MISLISNIDYTDIIVAIISVILTGYISFKTLKHQEKNIYAKEKYEYVIFPIFQRIEPYLYTKTIDNAIIELVKTISSIIKENRKYINGLLLEQIDLCNKELNSKGTVSKKTFSTLCSAISIEYDKSCKQLGVGKRTLAYKLNNRQIRPDKLTVLYRILLMCSFSCGIILIILISSIIINFLSNIIKLLISI